MKSQIIRFAATASLALVALSAAASFTGSAQAAAGNGDSDGRDFLTWQRQVGTSANTGNVDLADLNNVRNNFGVTY